mmetsp:Transcript_69775/g.202464  ORF Transcript_69775/g.202464 Transcript_69775/m.202464 type:complete len:480 (-) Transcript_69775:472-1911(-)
MKLPQDTSPQAPDRVNLHADAVDRAAIARREIGHLGFPPTVDQAVVVARGRVDAREPRPLLPGFAQEACVENRLAVSEHLRVLLVDPIQTRKAADHEVVVGAGGRLREHDDLLQRPADDARRVRADGMRLLSAILGFGLPGPRGVLHADALDAVAGLADSGASRVPHTRAGVEAAAVPPQALLPSASNQRLFLGEDATLATDHDISEHNDIRLCALLRLHGLPIVNPRVRTRRHYHHLRRRRADAIHARLRCIPGAVRDRRGCCSHRRRWRRRRWRGGRRLCPLRSRAHDVLKAFLQPLHDLVDVHVACAAMPDVGLHGEVGHLELACQQLVVWSVRLLLELDHWGALPGAEEVRETRAVRPHDQVRLREHAARLRNAWRLGVIRELQDDPPLQPLFHPLHELFVVKHSASHSLPRIASDDQQSWLLVPLLQGRLHLQDRLLHNALHALDGLVDRADPLVGASVPRRKVHVLALPYAVD